MEEGGFEMQIKMKRNMTKKAPLTTLLGEHIL